MSEERPLRVLSIAHTAVSRAAGRLRYHPFADRADFDVDLVVPARWKQFGRTITADPGEDPGVRTHVLPIVLPSAGPASWYLHMYPRLGRVMRATRPDVVHLWEEPWSLVALQACLLKRRAALVLEVDQNILKRLPPPFETIRRRVLARTDHVLSRSPDATAVVRATGYGGSVTEIGYGVDGETFRPLEGDRATGGGRAALRIGYVGRLVVEKGLDDVLEAVAAAAVPVELALMGEGPHEAALRARIAALGLADRVSLRGWGEPREVATFIRSLDALVLVTRTTAIVKEQFGRVVIEAQACGVPVIGSTCGAIPSVVGDGGWVVPESDPAALARLFATLAADPSAIAGAARAALANVEARFTHRAVAAALAGGWAAAAASRTSTPVEGHR